MAVSHLPSVGFLVSLFADTPVALNPAPFSNTKEIIILNLSQTETIFLAVGDPNALVTLQATTSTHLLPGASISLCIGVEGTRQKLSNDPSPSLNYILQAALASNVKANVNVTYIQAQGNSVGC